MSSFVRGYAGTLLPLVAGLVAIVPAWELLADDAVMGGHPWVAAALAVAAWGLGAAVWLRRRGWGGVPVHAVTWAVPGVVLVAPAVAGWLAPDGLVLWAPAITVLAASLAMVAQGDRGPVPG